MNKCMKCGHETTDPDALYCSRCGTKLILQPGSAQSPTGTGKTRKILMMMLPLNIVLITFAFLMVKGCSSVTGTLVSQGGAMGDFTFTPKECRSGQRLGFFGSVLLGEGQTGGAVVAIFDPLKGKIVKIEVPGSCEPPDYEKCKEVIVDPQYCSTYDVKLDRTSILVNDIVLSEGSLNLDCKYPDGGSVKGSMTFDRCN